MREVAALVDRNRKLFFKDKGMLFSSMITPLILIVLYATFLAKVYKDSYTSAFNNMVILVLFGSTLSSIISYPLTTQGQMSAVGTIVSAGYGFICGAYMPISNFGSGLQKALSYLPGTYGTSLLKNHMLRGIFEEMENEKLPEEMITAIREMLDCNPQFHGNVVNTTQMVFIMAGSIVVLGAIFLFMTRLPEKENR